VSVWYFMLKLTDEERGNNQNQKQEKEKGKTKKSL
jgi:hypothetical protein